MKVPGTTIDVRYYRRSEKIEMIGWKATCRYCDGIVKMPRENYVLQPASCWCLLCGQHYFVEINELLDVWEARQWRQKK